MKLAKYLETFTKRENAVITDPLHGFTQAANDLYHLSKIDKDDRDEAYRVRMTRVDDRISNYAFTANVLRGRFQLRKGQQVQGHDRPF